MDRIKRGVVIIACIMILAIFLFWIDYTDLSWNANKSNYLGFFSMIFTIIAMILPNKKKSDEK